MSLISEKFHERVLDRYQNLIEKYHKSRDRVIGLESNQNLLKAQIKDLSKHLTTVQSLLKNHETLIPSLENEVHRIKGEYAHIQKEHTQLLNYEKVLKNEIESLQSAHKKLQDYIQDMELRYQDLHENHLQISQWNQELETQKNKIQSEFDSLLQSYKTLELEFEKRLKDIDELTSLLELETDKYRVLWSDHEKLSDEFNERKKVQSSQEDQLNKLTKYIKELETINSTNQKEHKNLSNYIKELETINDTNQLDHKNLSNYIEELETINSSNQLEHSKLIKIINEHQQIDKNLNQHIESLQQENKRFIKIQETDRTEHQKLVEYIKILEDEAHLLKQDHQQIISERDHISAELKHIQNKLIYRIWQKIKNILK